MNEEIELMIDYPSNIASKLINGQIDIGLVPVVTALSLKEHTIISDYCIGCNGAVASVCLFSDVPLNEIRTILLDYQSKTSVALLKILISEHWKISPILIEGTENYQTQITGTTAGLVIGDRAFEQRLKSKYVYDLGLAWKEMTEMPFVFATWISNRALSPAFITAFNNANECGLKHLDEVVAQNPNSVFDLKAYYTRFIQFSFNEKMQMAKDLFLKKLADLHV